MFCQWPLDPDRRGFKQVEIKLIVAYLTAVIQRISIVIGWLALGFIVFVTLSPVGDRPSLASPHLEHFAAFALMGLAFALAYPNRVLLVVTIVIGAALSLEALQLLTPDRHGRAVDAFAKALGGISGICVGQMLSFLLNLKPVPSDHSA
jgi:putative Mn2+ efflux pump MntP